VAEPHGLDRLVGQPRLAVVPALRGEGPGRRRDSWRAAIWAKLCSWSPNLPNPRCAAISR